MMQDMIRAEFDGDAAVDLRPVTGLHGIPLDIGSHDWFVALKPLIPWIWESYEELRRGHHGETKKPKARLHQTGVWWEFHNCYMRRALKFIHECDAELALRTSRRSSPATDLLEAPPSDGQ